MASAWRFTEQDILSAATVWGSATADVPTCIVVQGSVVTLPDGEGEGAITETTTRVIISRPYAIKGATFFQIAFESGLQLIPGGGDKPVEFQPVQEIVTKVTKKNGCIMRTQTDTFEFYRPEAARYRQIASGGRQAVAGVKVDADGTVDGSEKAYKLQYEIFQLIRRVVTVPSYIGPLGELENIDVRTGQYFNPPAALFVANANPSIDPTRLGVFTLGSGAGVQIDVEKFFGGPEDPFIDIDTVTPALPFVDRWYQLDRTPIEHDLGYEMSRKSEQITTALTFTGTYIYDADGADTRRSLFPEGRAIVLSGKDIVRSAMAGEEGSHLEISSDSTRGFVDTITTKTLAQYLPPVDACSLELKLRQSSRPIAAVVCGGQETRRPVIQILDNPWVETVDECQAYAIQELRELQAVEVHLPIPPNGVLRKGEEVTIHVPQRGWVEQAAWIDTVGNAQEARGDGEASPDIRGRVIAKVSAF
ncbi:MAG: hypothetical protein V3T24_04765 [Longimicrobiales bacterium]